VTGLDVWWVDMRNVEACELAHCRVAFWNTHAFGDDAAALPLATALVLAFARIALSSSEPRLSTFF
jgi:hypothetical protein